MKKELCPWENRKLGCYERYVIVASQEEQEKIDKALGIIKISVRLPEEIYQDLINEADEAGLNLQALIREKLSKK